ncbi:MAG: YraN family protein [Verrucomicrobia bacterium]|nr:YraN family protein [Cytophagales bacterium]
MNNTQKGRIGEMLAVQWLLEKKYTILEKNYRFGKAEIDIIVEKDNVLVFVEVKWRSDATFGEPEIAVNARKKKLVRQAAENYIFAQDWQHDIRFDIIAITGKENPEIVHFEDVD